MSQEDRARVCVYLDGQVQGVGFRYHALRIAQDLGLGGYVMNLKNGGVKAEAEGDRKVLQKFVSRIKMGPRSAYVSNAEVSWSEYTHEFKDFEVRYF